MAKSLAEKILPKIVRDAVVRTIAPFLDRRAHKGGKASIKTQHERRSTLLLCVAQLWMLGYKIQKLESLAGKHIECLVTYWHENNVSPSLLHTRLSMLRVACQWMGKSGVVKDITDYLPAEAVARSSVAKSSLAWDAMAVDPLEIINQARQIDERLAVMLALQHHFGLRVKESIEIHPGTAVIEGGTVLEIHEGTKGGRPRWIRIDSAEKRDVISWARRVAAAGNSKRLRWTDCTWLQAQSRFYALIRRQLGISKKDLGVTAHGLRHGWSQRDYRRQTGLPTPVEGGALGRIDRETHQMACLTTSRALGHSRVKVAASYYGSYGHQLRTAPVKMVYQFNLSKEPKSDV